MGKKVKQALEAPPMASPWVMNLPQPPARNSEEYLKAYIGYIYTAVGAIAQEVASIDLKLFKVGYQKGKPKTTEIYEHESLSVLNYVNQLATFYDVVEATQIYLELTGEAFWVVLKEGNTPKEFWLLRPDWVKVVPSPTDVIEEYIYYAGGVVTEGVHIPKENIIPFKYFNPMNPYRGKGATQAAALSFDILNFAQEYNRNFFFNSAIPSMVFSTEQKISEQTIKRFLNQWQNSFGGRTKSNKVAFLGSGMKLDKASFGAKELDFAEQMKMMRDDVLAVFKVPKTVLGLTEDVNRANADSTTRAFMERVVTPRMRKFVDTLNEFFLPLFIGTENDIFFDFTDPAPEDVELKLKKYNNALGGGGSKPWMTQNEVRAEENLEPLPGGDDLAPVSNNPFAAPSVKPGEQKPGETTPPIETPPTETTPTTEPVPNESTKPTGNEAPKGLFARLFSREKKIEVYTPPTYLLKEKPIKHMVKIPVKRPQKLVQEQLAKSFVPLIRKYVGELVSQDDYAPLLKKKPRGASKTGDKAAEAIKGNKKKEDETELQGKSSGWTKVQKEAYWKQFIQHVTEREAQIKSKCQDIFKEQEKLVLEKLVERMKSFRKRLGIKATPSQVVPSLEDLDKMWKILEQLLREIYIEQGNYTMDFLGVGGNINITTEFASQYLLEYGGTLISGIDDTTRSQLMDTLSQGFDAGEGVDKLSQRVQDVFTIADDTRAEAIARTEAIKASNAATVEAYRQSGVVVGKEWLAEMDGDTCVFCEALDGKVIELDTNYFSLGDTFEVDGQVLSFDYAPVGEPPGHTNCRCTTIPVIDTSQQNAPGE